MPKANRICRNCGKPYYVCLSCLKSKSLYNICCCFACFRDYLAAGNQDLTPLKIDKGVISMQGILHNGNTVNILGFDLNNNKFDCDDKITHTGYEFKNFILDLRELKAIASNGKIEDADTD